MSVNEAVAAFMIEARELLDGIESSLLDLKVRPDDRALVDEVFRGLHTVKGSGAMFGFEALAAFTHHCESAFDRVRKGEAAATPDLVSVVLAACDQMRSLLEEPEVERGAASQALLARLEQVVQAAMLDGEQPAAADASATWRVRYRLPSDALANGTNALALLAELRDLGEATIVADVSEVPPLDLLSPTQCHLGWDVTLVTDQPRAAIEDVFIFVMDDMELQIEQLSGAPEAPLVAIETTAQTTAGPAAEAAPGAAASTRYARGGETMRVPAERLDDLMDRVGELVIAQSRLAQLANAGTDLNLRSVAEEIERLSGELRDTMMRLRMTPVGALFERFRRLAHDLARDTGKPVELVTEGEATELDKTIIERLADPLVHLIRNAVDHGLESPEDRAEANKPAIGRVRLAASQAGGEVIITVTDDGGGIDRERVRARAESQGLLEPGAQIGDSELLQMIFHPGFSTAQQVTSLSGRGVGMDVVKRTIEGLHGSIELTSTAGEGSQVSLRIPLTLAIIDGLLVRVAQGRYVIPLSAVEECIELSLEEDLRQRGRSFISLRERLVPFLRLRDTFATGTPPELHQKMVIVSSGADRVGLVVDQIIGDHQTVIKSLSKLHADVEAFSGATILGDGSVALILDVISLVSAGRQEAHLRAAG
jgi:two-component system chemotaxis sensor kinase CheA